MLGLGKPTKLSERVGDLCRQLISRHLTYLTRFMPAGWRGRQDDRELELLIDKEGLSFSEGNSWFLFQLNLPLSLSVRVQRMSNYRYFGLNCAQSLLLSSRNYKETIVLDIFQ